MKKCSYIIGIMLVLCTLAACAGQKKMGSKTAAFQATVLEVSEQSILIEPDEGFMERDVSDQIRITNIEGLELHVGDTIEIQYNGEIMETYPAQLGEVYSITLLE